MSRKRFCYRRGALVAAVSFAIPAYAAVPSFSGADGAGAQVTGGRGGVVYHVTKLDQGFSDSGIGTLHYGLTDSNFTSGGVVTPRTIVFDVGGTIWLGRNATDTEGWDTQDALNVGSNVTIAGQTAPGGITIAGGQLKVNGNGGATPNANSIIRNISITPGYGTRKANSTSGYYDQYTYDAMDVDATNVMVDHVSAEFSTDETISANELAGNVTVQYTSMSQGQNYPEQDAEASGVVYDGHAMGSLWSPGSGAKTSLLHNLYANQSTRLPTLQTEASKLSGGAALTDVRNNVIYNWLGNAGYGSSGEPGNGNMIGNYYKVGPGGDNATGGSSFAIVQSNGGTSVFSGSSSTAIYQTGNVRQNLDGTTTNLTNSNFGSSSFQSSPNSVPYNGVTDSASAAYNQVLNYVGANWQNRNAVDARIVNGVRTGTGRITAFDDASNGYNSAGVYVNGSTDTEWNKILALRGTANSGTGGTGTMLRPAGYDTDGDGMPDVWEKAMGLNPAVADNNGNITGDGYSNLDDYLDEVAAFPASTPLTFNNASGNNRYAQIGNWTTGVFEPSRYDAAQINGGTAIVDVPGQHAGTLSLATSIGNSASLTVGAGWIDIAQSLFVGPGGTGTVSQTGGVLHAGTSVVIGGTNNAGIYTLSNGTLSTPLLARGAKGGTFNFVGGTLHATTVAFDLVNQGGILAPGSDAQLEAIAAAGMPDINGNLPAALTNIGSTHVNGSLTLSSGTLQIELASPSSADSVIADNTLSLGGILDVEPLNGYVPHFGDQFKIGTATTITGAFASIPRGYTTQSSGGNLFLNPQLAEWNVNADGDSTTSGNWLGGVPGVANAGTDAGFLGAIAAARTITIDAAHTLATITFANTNAYTLVGDNVLGHGLTLDGGTLGGQINVTLGSGHAINSPLSINGNSTINTATGTALSIGGAFVVAAGKTVNKTGSGTLTIASTAIITAGSNSALAVTAGPLVINADPAGLALSADGAGTTINFGASSPGISARTVSSLTLTNNAVATAQGGNVAADHSQRSVLVAGTLAISGTSTTLNLQGNDLIVHGHSSAPSVLSSLTAQIASGFNADHGYWNGPGITSSFAASDTRFLTAVGILLNDDGTGNPLYSNGAFDNQNTAATDILVKYTWYGDADLNGTINGADYQQIDHGFASTLTGWQNGDFNYDGIINGSDFALIDNTFNQVTATGAASLAIVAGPTGSIARVGTANVPEPAMIGLVCVAGMGLGNRRRRL